MSPAILAASASEPTPPSEPGTTGMPSLRAVRLASILSPIRRMCSALRADELHAVLGEDFGKARVLRQEAVAGMHGVGAGDLAGGQNGRDVEIAVLGRRRADAHALVGEAHMHGVGVGGGMHRHGRNAELLAGAQHPQSDLAAIGDQDFIEHRTSVRPTCRHSMITSGSPNSTGWPSSNRIWITVPARGAGIWFMVFIASMISSVSPAFTLAADLDERLGAGLGRGIGGADHGRDHHARMLGEIERRRRPSRPAAAPGAAATRGAAGAAALRATRTRWPSCSISISVRPVSFQELGQLADQLVVDDGGFRRFCHRTFPLLCLCA